MENKKHVAVAGSSSPLDHLLLPKDPSSPSSTSAILGSIFPPPPKGFMGQLPGQIWFDDGGSGTTTNKDKSSSIYHSETVEPSYLGSSIYYGSQENYFPFNKATDAPQYIKKDDDPNGTILVELQEGIGGRAHCTTSILLQITNANAARGV
ncbi:hypothetical protein V6N13_098869 [Hibiscus sabdariffa]